MELALTKPNKHGVLVFSAKGSSKTKQQWLPGARYVFPPLHLIRFFFALWLVRFAPLSPVAVETSGEWLLVKGLFAHCVICVSCDWPARFLQLPVRKPAISYMGGARIFLRGVRWDWAISNKRNFYTAKTTEKKSYKESLRGKIKPVLSTFDVKKLLPTQKKSCTI